jgi:hypothetical protein
MGVVIATRISDSQHVSVLFFFSTWLLYVEQLLVLFAGSKAGENIHRANKTVAIFFEFPSRYRGICDSAFMQQESAKKEYVSCKGTLFTIVFVVVVIVFALYSLCVVCPLLFV